MIQNRETWAGRIVALCVTAVIIVVFSLLAYTGAYAMLCVGGSGTFKKMLETGEHPGIYKVWLDNSELEDDERDKLLDLLTTSKEGEREAKDWTRYEHEVRIKFNDNSCIKITLFMAKNGDFAFASDGGDTHTHIGTASKETMKALDLPNLKALVEDEEDE